tara:strand:- start:2271 stop:2882 length:612 start_codon:yes stop_codon:yes gene_type:complete
MMKKAAMFGLDARIALAIFGALSVISGAALYSAIQAAKVQTVVSFFSETTKAVEAYALDVGALPPAHATRTQSLAIKELVDSSANGWKGPYVSYETMTCFSATDACLKHTSITKNDGSVTYSLINPKKHDTGDAYDSNLANCTSGIDCTLWVHIEGLNSSLAKAVDQYIDGSTDAGEGRVRMPTPSNNSTNIFFNTGIPIEHF